MASSIARKTRELILDAALASFLRCGFEACSMDAVAAEAGVARRTVFNRFRTKEVLFKAAVETLWARLPQQEILNDDALLRDVRAGLARIARVTLDFWSQDQSVALLRLVIAESSRFPFLLQSYLERGKLPAFGHMIEYLEAAKARGRIAIEDTHLAAQQFMGLLKEPLVWSQVIGMGRPPSAEERERVADEAVTMFLLRYPLCE